jgi:hypothetical protein
LQPGGCISQAADASPPFFRPDPAKLEILAMNGLREPNNATPAISDGQIFLRTDAHLYCIAEQKY